MTEIGIASIYKRDREDLRQWTQEDLVREAWLLKRKIARHEGEQIVDDYETGAEWEAALERRQTALTVALKEAGLEDFKIPSRRGPRSMKAKRHEFIGRYQARFTAIIAELERRGLTRL